MNCFSFPNLFFSANTFFACVFFLVLGNSHTVSYAQGAGDTWTKMADLPAAAAPRNRGVAMAINGKGYFGTGWDGGNTYYSSWWEYDPASDSWTQKANFNGGTNPRNRACGFSLNGKGYVALGADNSQVFTGLFEYNPSSNTWSQKANYGGGARYSSVAFTVGNFAYVGLGDDGSTSFNDFWKYDPGNNTWSQIAPFPGTGRYSAAAFSIGNFGYVGTGYDGTFTDDFWQYNPLTNMWVQKANFPGTPRSMAVGFSIGRRGYLGAGGTAVASYDDLWEYNPVSNQWMQSANFGGGARLAASAFVINGEVYVVAGSTGYDTGMQKDLWKYTPLNIPPVTFQKSYGGTNDDTDQDTTNTHTSYGCPTNDGGYVIASSTKSFGTANGKNDVYVIKTDPLGLVQWANTYGSSTLDESPSSIRQTTDGGFILAGEIRQTLNSDMFILKLDAAGNSQWTRVMSGSGIERANYAEEIPGGEYIVTGRAAGMKTCLIKLDAGGNPTTLTKTFAKAGVQFDEGFSVEQTSSGYLIGGQIKTTGNNFDTYLVVSDATGSLAPLSLSIGNISSLKNETRGIIKQTPDGGYLLCGSTDASSGNGYDVFLVKMNTTGNAAWSYHYGGTNDDVGRALAIDYNGNYLVGGFTKSFGAGAADALLLCVNTSGNLLWAKAYGGSAVEKVNSVYQTADGGFFLSGETFSFSSGMSDVYTIKTDSIGNSGCNETSINTISTTSFAITTSTGTNIASLTGIGTSTTVSQPASAPINKLCINCTFPITMGKTDVICFGNCDGTAAVMASTGAQPLTYAWSNSATTSAISNLCAGTYYVTVTDTNGCVAVDSVKIFEPPPVVIGIGKNNDVFCFGNCDGSASASALTGVFPFTYQWSNGETNFQADSLCAGTHTVVVADGNGCTAVDSVNITEPPQLLVNLLNHFDSVCLGDSLLIGSTPSGGTPPYVFFWYPPASLACDTCQFTNVSPSADTTYYLEVYDDNGCLAEDSVVVTVSPLPNILAGNDDTICSGQNTTLTATGGVSYVWTPSTGLSCTSCANPVASPTVTPALYSVIGTDANGCSNKDSVIVTVVSTPTVNITTTASLTICSGDTVFLNASSNASSYSWSTGGTNSAILDSPTITTVYTVTVTSTNGCTAAATKTVTVNPIPVPTFTATVDVSCFGLCNGSSTVSSSVGTSPFTYVWQPVGQSAQTATGLCPGTYTAYVADTNGCSASATDIITEPAILDMAVSSVDASCTCSGSAAIDSAFGGTAPYFYVWNWATGSSINQTISGLCAGTYSATVTDNNGCTDLHTVTISQLPSFTVSTSASDTLCSGTSAQLNASVNGSSTNITYMWFPAAGLNNPNISNPVASPANTTSYSVIAEDTLTNCSDTGYVTVNVIASPTASITGPDTVCVGTQITLTGSGSGSYLWNTGETTTSIIGTPTSAATYIISLTVTDSLGNFSCAGADTFTVTAVSSPAISVYQKYDTICSGLSFDTLIASGGTNYSWSSNPPTFPPLPNNDTIIVSPDLQGQHSYTVFVSSGNGCTGFSTVTVTVQGGYPDPAVSGTFIYCDGDSILPVTASAPPPPAITVWFDSTGTQIASGNTFFPPQDLAVGTTSYLAIQGTSDACVSYPTVFTFTINPIPIADAGNDITVCSGHTAHLNATGGTAYAWSPPDFLNQTNIFNPSANPDSTFSYQVLVSDANNCNDIDSITVFISAEDTCGIHIYNVLTPNSDGDNDVWYIDGINLFPDNIVEIYNRWGNLVWRGIKYDNRKVAWHGQNNDGRALPAGTYYYVINVKGLGQFSKWVELLR